MKRILLSALVLFCLGSVSYGQSQGPWGPWPNNEWRGPRPRGAGRIVGEGLKRAWEIERAQIQQAYQERLNEQRRYDAAVQREWEADRRATYAERYYPSSWQAEKLRQQANQASMERARAEVAVRLRAQNDRQFLYGGGISTAPTRQQSIRSSPINNRTQTTTQSREPGDRDRLKPETVRAIRAIERELGAARERDRREANQTTDTSTEDRRQRWLDNRP